MDRLELHDVEYGDCTVLVGRDNSVLMVDCGSVSRYTRQDETEIDRRFEAIFSRYDGARQRQFLLTHCHRDHMNGFLKKLRRDPGYFDRVYIPALPVAERGANPILEFAVFSHFFSVPQSDFAQINTTCLRLFSLLDETVGPERLFTLRAGDVFAFDGVFYAVLSPEPAGFPFDPLLSEAAEAMNVCLASPFHTGAMRADITRSPAAPDIREILDRPVLRTLYTETLNDLSLVFHNVRTGGAGNTDVLMTGDVSGAVLSRLAPKLYDGYYAVKAPHHGTESHYSAVLGDLAVAHLLISNGDYHAGGEISARYTDMECIKHCTNPGACAWFRTAGSCCNRLLRCYEQGDAGRLTLRCPAAGGNRRTPCNIYVFSHNGARGCHCD